MPRMDGFALADKLMHMRPDTKVLFITAEADRSVAICWGLKGSGRPFLFKPFTPRQLGERIRAVLDDDE